MGGVENSFSEKLLGSKPAFQYVKHVPRSVQFKHTHRSNTQRVSQNVTYMGKYSHFKHPYLIVSCKYRENMSNMWENVHRSVQFKHTHSNNTHIKM